MKLYNLMVNGSIHLGVEGINGIVDATAAGETQTMEEIVAGGSREKLGALAADANLPVVSEPVYANVITNPSKLVCVGLNYYSHAASSGALNRISQVPLLFSKYNSALVPSGAEVNLPSWEKRYDYEAELVIVIGKKAWNVSEEEAKDCIFGYTAGNDLSCRDAQMRVSQWLCGKSMPGFGPCGPCIATKDEIDPEKGISIRSYVNGRLLQDGSTTDMVFTCAQIISYASKYIGLEPGDLIYTGTPSGVQTEKDAALARWLTAGDKVDVEIEGIGTLTNYMVCLG